MFLLVIHIFRNIVYLGLTDVPEKEKTNPFALLFLFNLSYLSKVNETHLHFALVIHSASTARNVTGKCSCNIRHGLLNRQRSIHEALSLL